MKVLEPSGSYTFSKIFEMKIIAQDLAQEFGYSLARRRLALPQFCGELDRIEQLRDRIEETLPYVPLSTEAARREVLISPIVIDLIHYTKAEMRIEYPIKVTNQLQGSLDYLLRSQNQLLIIEAKREDLDFGFSQLAAQLIAMDKWDSENPSTHLLGAVTTGKLWEFGLLDRTRKHIDQGLDSFRVPDDLDPLMRILIHALSTDSNNLTV